jgi:hypothetical protein
MTVVIDLAEEWDELVSTALIGTDRHPLPPPAGPTARFGTGDDAASALLDRVAAVQAARRAGALPTTAGEPLPPAPVDPRPPCPTPVSRRLGAVLHGQHPELLGELVRGLADRGWVLPPEHLLTLMDRTRNDPDVHRLVVAAAGPILPWLGALLPRLGWPTAEPNGSVLAAEATEVWERGAPAERVELLRRLRVTEPERARELLAGGLAKERADHRAACLATLVIGLSPDDEPLLEEALSDRSAPVREVAVSLLATLPSSAWAARMASRAREMVSVDARGAHDRLDVRLVAPVPPEWERDGITAAAPAGTSVGAHVLHQVLAGAPLSTWSELGRPVDLVVLASEHELREVVLGAWAEAAARQHDSSWARLLVEEIDAPELVGALTADDVGAVALRRATADELLTPLTLAALAALPPRWPAEIRRRVGGALMTLFVDRRAGRHQAPLLSRLVRVLDPGVLRPLAGALSHVELAPPVDGVRDDVVEVARFRVEMLEELAAEAEP